MKVALSVWKDCMSTVFDAENNLLVLDIEKEKRQNCIMLRLNAINLAARAAELKEYGVEVLICGAISRLLQTAITDAGIKVYPFVRGPVDDVITAYQQGKLEHEAFALPGCRRRNYAGRHRQKNGTLGSKFQ